MRENEIARHVVDAAFHLHCDLGPGLLESVYEVLLARALEKRGLKVERQKPIRIESDGIRFDEGFRADLMVGDLVIVELKSVEELHPSHKKQLKSYLKLADKRLGLLINFGTPLIKEGISRVALGLPEKYP
jgi:GxxExxY protein